MFLSRVCPHSRGGECREQSRAGAGPVWVWWTWDHLANCHNVSECRLQRNQVNKTGDKCPDTTQPRAASSCQHLRDQQNTGDTEVKRRRLFIKAFLYNSNWYLLPRDWGWGSAALGQAIVRTETDTLRLQNSFNEERIMINIPPGQCHSTVFADPGHFNTKLRGFQSLNWCTDVLYCTHTSHRRFVLVKIHAN